MTLSPTQKDRINDKFLSIEMWVENIRKMIDKDFHVKAKKGLDQIAKDVQAGRELIREEAI